jgi:hypothetical protein
LTVATRTKVSDVVADNDGMLCTGVVWVHQKMELMFFYA